MTLLTASGGELNAKTLNPNHDNMHTNSNFIEINKKSWNARTQEHYDSKFYDVEAFLKGKSSLNEIEIELLGDIRGKKILHLQCHFGMDSISLTRMGAKVVGVDLSDQAIEKARLLAKETHSDAKFVCCNIFDLPAFLTDSFDIVFMSYGVVSWYPDLDKLGSIVNHYLKPKGRFVLVEFHPVLWMFNDQFNKIESPYSHEEPFVSVSETYTNAGTKGVYEEVTWNHGLSKVIQGLLNNKLQITHFEEYDYSPFNLFGNMTEENGKFRLKGMEKMIPILFSIVAEKS